MRGKLCNGFTLLTSRGEGAERRGNVPGPHFDVSRHLFRAGPGSGRADRGAGAGDHRRFRHQAAHRAIPAHTGIRRTVRRRSNLGDGIDWRHGRRWPAAGDQDQLPISADALQSRPCAGTESDNLVFAAPAGELPQFRRQSRHRHQLDSIRERRNHAAQPGETTAPSPAVFRRC